MHTICSHCLFTPSARTDRSHRPLTPAGKLTRHLRDAHGLPARAVSANRERLGQYIFRGTDGMVHRWIHRCANYGTGQVTRRCMVAHDATSRHHWPSAHTSVHGQGAIRRYWQDDAAAAVAGAEPPGASHAALCVT